MEGNEDHAAFCSLEFRFEMSSPVRSNRLICISTSPSYSVGVQKAINICLQYDGNAPTYVRQQLSPQWRDKRDNLCRMFTSSAVNGIYSV